MNFLLESLCPLLQDLLQLGNIHRHFRRPVQRQRVYFHLSHHNNPLLIQLNLTELSDQIVLHHPTS
jgi:hypothetical protein